MNLVLLKEIFQTPRIHTDFGYHRRHDGIELQRKRARTTSGDWEDTNTRDLNINEEGSAAKSQLGKLLAEKAALDNKINEVKGIIDDHECRREEKCDSDEAEKQHQKEEQKHHVGHCKIEQNEGNEEKKGCLWMLGHEGDRRF